MGERAIRLLLQRGLRAMLTEKKWDKVPLNATLEAVSRTAGLNILCMTERLEILSAALSAMMCFLVEMGAVEEMRLRMSSAIPIELRPDWDRDNGLGRIGYKMRMDAHLVPIERQSLEAALKLVTELSGTELVQVCVKASVAKQARLQEQMQKTPGQSQSGGG